MIIQVDTREKQKAIKHILAYFDYNGIKHISSKMYVGDYQSLDNPKIAVDRKLGLQEVVGNVTQQHERFRDELIRAKDCGIQLIVLIEEKNIKELKDVNEWYNPRLKTSKKATTGQTLFKIMFALEIKYGVKFMFCTKNEMGKKIVDLLSKED